MFIFLFVQILSITIKYWFIKEEFIVYKYRLKLFINITSKQCRVLRSFLERSISLKSIHSIRWNTVDEMDDVLRFSTSRRTLLRSKRKKKGSKSSLCFKKQRIPKTNRQADGNPIQPAVTLKAEELVTKDKAGEDDGRQCCKKEPTNQAEETSQSLSWCVSKKCQAQRYAILYNVCFM